MNGKYLMILEVSQKQSFIFNEKKLRNNVLASNAIAYVTSSEFFQRQFGDLYNEKDNLIYAGGGHTFLLFADDTSAIQFGKAVTYYVLKNIPGMELFITTMPYDCSKRPSDNIKALTTALEEKKGMRRASFYQTTFGIEHSGRRMSTSEGTRDGYMSQLSAQIKKQIEDDTNAYAEKRRGTETINVEKAPYGYKFVTEHGDLGGSNFIAVIHIDGNQMGSRVLKLDDLIAKDAEGIAGKLDKENPGLSESRKEFEIWRYYNRKFSESIDFDFKKALQEVYKDLSMSMQEGLLKNEFQERFYFPLRKIIAAGDDICFVTDGRLGLECAEHFIRHLEQQRNAVDGNVYHACAGVAIVHEKYPFYRAYDMAEQLCSNAKKEMAKRIGQINAYNEEYDKKRGRRTTCMELGSLSAIDWHIEYGEMMGDLEDIREGMTALQSGKYKEIFGRPYQITDSYDPNYKEREIAYYYKDYKKLVRSLKASENQDAKHPAHPAELLPLDIPRNKQKEMRGAIKAGEKAYTRYLTMNCIDEDTMQSAPRVFDAIESMDLFLPMD